MRSLISSRVLRRSLFLIAMMSIACYGCASNPKEPVQAPTSQAPQDGARKAAPIDANMDVYFYSTPADEYGRPMDVQTDGRMSIQSMGIHADITGTIAVVSVDLVINNPNERFFTGALEIPIPKDAVVNGFSFYTAKDKKRSDWKEAYFSPTKTLMQEIASHYENYEAGANYINNQLVRADRKAVAEFDNRFKINTFIQGNTLGHYRLTYTTPLVIDAEGNALLRFPTVKSDIKRFDIRAEVKEQLGQPELVGFKQFSWHQSNERWGLHEQYDGVNFVNDIRIAIPKVPDAAAFVEESDIDGETLNFAIDVKVGSGAGEPAQPKDLSDVRILWDASGDRSAEAISASSEVLSHLPEAGHYVLHVFRNELEAPREFSSRDELIAAVRALTYDGVARLTSLSELAQTQFDGETLVFTHGMDAYGEALPVFASTATAILAGKARDALALKQMHADQILDLNVMTADEAYKRVILPPRHVAQVLGEHISDVREMRGISPDRVLITGLLHFHSDLVKVVFSDGSEIAVPITDQTLLQRGHAISSIWVNTLIQDLAHFPVKNHLQLEMLSQAYSVATPATVLLPGYRKEPKDEAESHFNLSDWLNDDPEDLGIVNSQWQELTTWWANPVPANLKTYYHCANKDGKDCVAALFSDRGFHYEQAYVPAAKWKCTSKNNCSLNSQFEEPSYACGVSFGMGGGSDWGGIGFNNIIGPQLPYLFERFESEETYDELQSNEDSEAESLAYMERLLELQNSGADANSFYATYLELKQTYKSSVAFYFNVSQFFFENKLPQYGMRVLSNILRFNIEDKALLLAYAWNASHYGAYDEAVAFARKLLAFDPKGRLSWRSLAHALESRSRVRMDAKDATEALKIYHKLAFEPGERYELSPYYDMENELALAGRSVEEMNAFITWINQQNWPAEKPVTPTLDQPFNQVIDSDLRIVVEGFCDSKFGDSEFNINLYVLEPTGEGLYYQEHRYSATGGRVARDGHVTYYQIKQAKPGKYKLFAAINARSRNPVLMQPQIVTTVYRNWGRANQTKETFLVQTSDINTEAEIGKSDSTCNMLPGETAQEETAKKLIPIAEIEF